MSSPVVKNVNAVWEYAPVGFPAVSYKAKVDNGSILRLCLDYVWDGIEDDQFYSYVSWFEPVADGATFTGLICPATSALQFLAEFDGSYAKASAAMTETYIYKTQADGSVFRYPVSTMRNKAWEWTWPFNRVVLGSGYKVSLFEDVGQNGSANYLQVLPPWVSGDGVPRFNSAFTSEVSKPWAEDAVLCGKSMLTRDPTIVSAVAAASSVLRSPW